MRDRWKRFRRWIFTPAGAAWYFGIGYVAIALYWWWVISG